MAQRNAKHALNRCFSWDKWTETFYVTAGGKSLPFDEWKQLPFVTLTTQGYFQYLDDIQTDDITYCVDKLSKSIDEAKRSGWVSGRSESVPRPLSDEDVAEVVKQVEKKEPVEFVKFESDHEYWTKFEWMFMHSEQEQTDD
jgi:hypothetical protein